MQLRVKPVSVVAMSARRRDKRKRAQPAPTSQCEKKQTQEASGVTTETPLGRAHRSEAGARSRSEHPHWQAFLRVLQSSDEAKLDPIAGLDDVAFRVAHREHFQLPA
jgi:hypothetical protein